MLTADTPSDSARHFACLACALLGSIAWSVMAPAAVLDQAQDATSSNINVGPSDQRIAQTFTAGVDGELEKVRLRVANLPSLTSEAPNLILEIMNTDQGVPNGAVLGTASLPHTAFPDAGGLVISPTRYTDFDFAGVPLHAGTRYALGLRAAADTCGLVSCAAPAYRVDDMFGGDPYPAGQLFLGTGAVPTFLLVGDLSFQTFMGQVAHVPEPNTWLVLIAGLAALAVARGSRPSAARRPVRAFSAAHFEPQPMGGNVAMIVGPSEHQLVAFARDDVEHEVRIGRHRRMQLRAKYLLAAIGAHEGVDDVTRNRATYVVEPEARLHWMDHHRANFNGLAALGVLRDPHPGFAKPAHGAQPPTVTSTSTAADHKLSSLMTATACRC